MFDVDANGAKIPALGLGTWELRGETAVNVVEGAIALGYHHIDTAQRYENEYEVGEGIRKSGVDPSNLFVTTKIWPDHFEPHLFLDAVKQRLDLLKLEKVNLLLLHWPNPDRPLAETIELLNQAKAEGLTNHIGVSNFTASMIESATKLSEAPLACNQIEYHPFLSQEIVMDACRNGSVAITAYCPIARGEVSKDPVIQAIAEAHLKTPVQIALRWLVQQTGVIAIPRTSSLSRAKSNIDIFDFTLSTSEMQEIDKLGRARRRLVNLDIAPDWD